MTTIYKSLRFLSHRWLTLAIVLIAATLGLGITGYAVVRPGASHPILNDVYHTLRLFLLDCDAADADLNIWLRIARWLGFLVWSFTIFTVLGRVFRGPARDAFVYLFARDHIVLAGLGDVDEDRNPTCRTASLKRGIRSSSLNPIFSTPNWDACRDLGAVCLHGVGRQIGDLKRAQLKRAKAMIVLGEVDRTNIEVATSAQQILSERKRSDDDLVKCLIQINEPGLLDVIRRLDVHTNRYDRLDLQLFNRHEMAARAMLRETMVDRDGVATDKRVREFRDFRKILVVGIGRHGRMGEALVTRATKDKAIDSGLDNLEIHVVDEVLVAGSVV